MLIVFPIIPSAAIVNSVQGIFFVSIPFLRFVVVSPTDPEN
jgi:hypothetical protein